MPTNYTYRDLTITAHDALEYETLIDEIFKKNTYYVDLDNPRPRIVDAGAHIGMSTLYFKKLYPHAEVLAIEPDPRSAKLLRENIEQNGLTDVSVITKALIGAHGAETVVLYQHPLWGVFSSVSQGGWTRDQHTSPLSVETMRLSTLLELPVDILKVDIEGLETEVLSEASDRLHNVGVLFVEFHKTATHIPDKLLKILRAHFKQVAIEEDERHEKNPKNQLFFIEARH